MIKAEILLDSVNPVGNRITTWILTIPRIVLAELNTHRMFSRNASSSRAIPVKTMIDRVKNDPFLPVYWGRNQSGMQAAEELTSTEIELAKIGWLRARDDAIASAESLLKIGLHKQITSRLLEPWMYTVVLLTATEFENFFSLRAHKDAQPEIQNLAYQMLELYNSHIPTSLEKNNWHIPFGDRLNEDRVKEISKKNGDTILDTTLKIATARCARTSYLNFDGKDDYDADIALTDRLATSGHWSPFEHCSQALPNSVQSGNFIGWLQYRKRFGQENRKDERVKRI